MKKVRKLPLKGSFEMVAVAGKQQMGGTGKRKEFSWRMCLQIHHSLASQVKSHFKKRWNERYQCKNNPQNIKSSP